MRKKNVYNNYTQKKTYTQIKKSVKVTEKTVIITENLLILGQQIVLLILAKRDCK